MSAQASTASGGGPTILQALRKVGPLAAFAVAPVAVLATMLYVGLDPGPLAHDFHYEVYPEAEALLDGRNPFPASDFDPLSPEPNLIWPPVAALLASPLTLLPLATADVVMVALGLTCFAAALWLMDVRDWRVYGAFALWPQVAGEMRVSHFTPFIGLLLALAWRHRGSELRAGAAVGAAVGLKLFVWPVGVWLLARREARGFALAAAIALASLLLVLPYTGLETYLGALRELAGTFDQDSYTVFGFLVQLGVADPIARTTTVFAGAALLAGVWRFRSFTLAVAASLMLSPIVWLDYLAITAIPLAAVLPRLTVAWLLPLFTWGAAGAGIGVGEPFDIGRVLAIFTIVLAISYRGERALQARNATPGRISRGELASVSK